MPALARPSASLAPGIESLRQLVASYLRQALAPFTGGPYALVAYHLGWQDVDGRPRPTTDGKMVRPLFCLAACRSFGDPQRAVGLAAAVELLHAFSLVHDDIEDGDRTRRGRPALWTLAGVPLAINAGDCLFALAFRTAAEGIRALPPGRELRALRVFAQASLRMIEGQHLDLEYETRPTITLDEYIAMARLKTGALLSASLALGGLAGGAPSSAVETLAEAGLALGVAFQATDDALAFWGDPAQTGKAVGNDLARGKKSLPLVLAAAQGFDVHANGTIHLEGVRAALERLDTRNAVRRFAAQHAARARQQLDRIALGRAGRDELLDLIAVLLTREV